MFSFSGVSLTVVGSTKSGLDSRLKKSGFSKVVNLLVIS